jgi:hypothetical protein
MKLSAITRRFIFVVFLAALCGGYAHAQRLVIVGWNIESGGATDAVVTQRVRSFQGVDLWGFIEAGSDTSLQSFEVAAEDGENADFKRLLSQTGCGDRLGIVFNATRLQLVGSQELHRVTYNADQPSVGRCRRSRWSPNFRIRAQTGAFFPW